VGCGFCISIYWIYIRRSLQSLITFPITSHKPVTSSGSSFALNWRKLLLWWTPITDSCGELLWQTPMTELLGRTPFTDSFGKTALANSYDELLSQTASIINPSCFYNLGNQLLVCSLPRYMRAYRPLLSCNNTPLFWLPRLFCLQNCWEQFSCIRGYIILMDYVSIAWQWIFPAWGNSAFQTTCHNILQLPMLVTSHSEAQSSR
jgi:hypothetical protein